VMRSVRHSRRVRKGYSCASQQAAKREPVTCCLAVAQRVGMIRTNPNHEATKVIDNQDQTEREAFRRPRRAFSLNKSTHVGYRRRGCLYIRGRSRRRRRQRSGDRRSNFWAAGPNDRAVSGMAEKIFHAAVSGGPLRAVKFIEREGARAGLVHAIEQAGRRGRIFG